MNLRGHGIRTVQQLAKMSPAGVPSAIGALITEAKNYVKVAGNGGTAIAAKIAELQGLNETLVEENRILKNTIETLKASQKAA